MIVLPTPHAISDFTRALLLSDNSPVNFQLYPRHSALTLTPQEFCESSFVASITCPQFATRLLPLLRAAFFRAKAQGQLLTCDAHWLRYQVHAHLLGKEVDYYFAHELDLLERAAALRQFIQGHRWPYAVLTFGAQHVHLHGARNRQEAAQGDYVQKPFISQLWPAPAVALLLNELGLTGILTEAWVPYDANLFAPLRLRRKLQLLSDQ